MEISPTGNIGDLASAKNVDQQSKNIIQLGQDLKEVQQAERESVQAEEESKVKAEPQEEANPLNNSNSGEEKPSGIDILG